jgi:Fic family protein
VPNPDVLLSPLTTQEAVLSSRIEGTQVTLGEVLKFEAGTEPEHDVSRREDIQEIMNYRRALRHAEAELLKRPFNLNMLLGLHGILLDSVRGRDRGRGRFRTVQNYIGKPGSTIAEADFIPPEPARIMEHLDNWERYYHAERPDPLVQLALIHAQFEVIHPFVDGNGRLGRILIPIFLYEKKLLRRPMFYLSGYLECHRDDYYRRLRDIGRSKTAWNTWIEFFLSAVEDQARGNADKARAVMDLYDHLKKRVIDLTRSRFAVPLLDQLFERPVFQSAHIKIGGEKHPSRQLVAHLLRVLRDEGVLSVVRGGRGRQGQVLALGALVNLCEGKTVI